VIITENRSVWRSVFLWPRLWLSAICVFAPSASAHADGVTGSTYVRVDSDRTTVISPHARAAAKLSEQLEVNAAYSADVWSSASVDIRASASVRPGSVPGEVHPVTEQRDQFNVGVAQSFEDWSLSGGYRLSIEPDYLSNGGTLGTTVDLASNAARLSANLSAFFDLVGRSGDPNFSRGLATYIANLSFTQIIDPNMLVQLTYEPAHARGYQASPYRWVGFGGDASGFGCAQANQCWPEKVPRARWRHALAVLVRRALGPVVSVGASYRFYLDDWGLLSHTLLGDVGINLAEHTLLSLQYRFYTQNGADFYRRRYAGLTVSALRTRDRELSPLQFHRLGLEIDQRIYEFDQGRTLVATFGVGGNFYFYSDFVGLERVRALEVTAALVIGL
jgi:hypothetical protein